MFTKAEKSSFPYWFAHWCAYQMTALNAKAWKFKYLFHDIEKPFLKLFISYDKVKTYHRNSKRHHVEWLESKLKECELITGKVSELDKEYLLYKFDYEGAIIDWECCHYTKSEEPLDAHEEYKRLLSYDNFSKKYPLITKYCYNEFSMKLMDAIKKLDLENN